MSASQCKALTKKRTQCKIKAINIAGLCKIHSKHIYKYENCIIFLQNQLSIGKDAQISYIYDFECKFETKESTRAEAGNLYTELEKAFFRKVKKDTYKKILCDFIPVCDENKSPSFNMEETIKDIQEAYRLDRLEINSYFFKLIEPEIAKYYIKIYVLL